MKITVAICTWNRSKLLAQTLTSLCEVHIPTDVEWEVIVVDNNSDDETRSVCEQFMGPLPLRYVFEPKQGKSYALNRAVNMANGEYIVWTDDDVLLSPSWIEHYANAFNSDAEYAFWGGPVEPYFSTHPPSWLCTDQHILWPVYAIVDHGPEPLDFSKSIFPAGVNWAIRANVQREALYDVRLGPRPEDEQRGEETTLFRQLLGMGHRGRWIPESKIKHYIPQRRMTLTYIRDFYFGQGVSFAKFAKYGLRPTSRKQRWLAIPRLICKEAKFRFHQLTKPEKDWVRHLATAASERGFCTELLRRR